MIGDQKEALMEDPDERLQSKSDDAVQGEIEHRSVERLERTTRCLAALRASGVEFDCVTGMVLQEIGAQIIAIIHEVVEEESR